MQEIIDGIIQVGILPVIIGYLLFDQSRKIEAMKLELVKINQTLMEIERHIEKCNPK